MKVKKLPHRSLLFAGVFLTGAFFVKATSEEHTLSFPTNPNTKTTEEVIPLTISSGFDKDFIAEAKPAQTHSSERMDDVSWVYYSADLQSSGGLPSDGIVKSGNVTYQLAPYTGNNATRIVVKNKEEKTLTFGNPVKANKLMLLATSTNGKSLFQVTLNYDDGSNDTATELSIDDWNGNEGAITGLGRIFRTWKEGGFDSGAYDDDIDGANFRLSEVSISSDPAKIVNSITIKGTGNEGYLIPFAVSAIIGGETPEQNTLEIQTIENQNVEVGKTVAISTIYSLGGAKKDDNFKIDITSDNTSVTISDISNTEDKINFSINGINKGTANITVTLTNGKFVKEISFNVFISENVQITTKYVPVKLVGYTKDIIAENKPASSFTNDGMDNDGKVFYTTDVNSIGALPANGIIIGETSKASYQLAPYNENNAFFSDCYKAAGLTNIQFAEPIKTKELMILATSANGSSDFGSGEIYFSDGTSQSYNFFTVNDWFDPKNNVAVKSLYLIERGNDAIDERNFGLYENKLTISEENIGKEIKSISFLNESGGSKPGSSDASRLYVFAVSALVEQTPVNTLELQNLDNQTVEIGKSLTLSATYSLGNAPKEENFKFDITSDNAAASITEISNTDSQVNFNVNGVSEGSANITIKLTNGEFSKESTFSISITAVEEEPAYIPVTLTGFNKDVIAEDVPASGTTDAGLDNDGKVFFGNNVNNGTGALPANGIITSINSGVKYQLASYESNNAFFSDCYTDRGLVEIQFATPVSTKSLMILATSTNGASDFGAGSSGTGKITFEDNTTETYSSINVKDWFQSGEPDASTAQNKLYLIGRNDDAIDTRNFSIYEYKLNITNYKKKIKSISFTNESGGSKPGDSYASRLFVFAISALQDNTPTPVEPVIDPIENTTIKIGNEPTTINAFFSLGGEEQGSDFSIKAIANNDFITISNENISNETYSFDIAGVTAGESIITVTLINNGHTITQDFSVTIEPKDPVVNIAEIPRQTFKKGETISVKVNYDFDGEAEQADFSYMVYTNMVIDPNVRISNVNIDKDEQVISFNLTGIGVGSSYVNVYVFNNGTSATQIFTAEVKEQTITGLDSKSEKTISIYPNPVKHGENLIIETENAQIIQIINLQGIVMKTIKAPASIEKIDIDEFIPGIYMVAIKTENNQKVEKITVK